MCYVAGRKHPNSLTDGLEKSAMGLKLFLISLKKRLFIWLSMWELGIRGSYKLGELETLGDV